MESIVILCGDLQAQIYIYYYNHSEIASRKEAEEEKENKEWESLQAKRATE